MSNTPPPGIKDPYGPGLTWDEASPDGRRIYAANQAWAKQMGFDRNPPNERQNRQRSQER